MATKKAEDITVAEAENVTMMEAENVTMMETVEPKYTLEKLRANCRKLFDVSSSTFTGATAEMTGEYTVNEIKEAIRIWQKKEAK